MTTTETRFQDSINRLKPQFHPDNYGWQQSLRVGRLRKIQGGVALAAIPEGSRAYDCFTSSNAAVKALVKEGFRAQLMQLELKIAGKYRLTHYAALVGLDRFQALVGFTPFDPLLSADPVRFFSDRELQDFRRSTYMVPDDAPSICTPMEFEYGYTYPIQAQVVGSARRDLLLSEITFNRPIISRSVLLTLSRLTPGIKDGRLDEEGSLSYRFSVGRWNMFPDFSKGLSGGSRTCAGNITDLLSLAENVFPVVPAVLRQRL